MEKFSTNFQRTFVLVVRRQRVSYLPLLGQQEGWTRGAEHRRGWDRPDLAERNRRFRKFRQHQRVLGRKRVTPLDHLLVLAALV